MKQALLACTAVWLAAGLLFAGCRSRAPAANVVRVAPAAEIGGQMARTIKLRERTYVRAGAFIEVNYTFTPGADFRPTDRPLSVMAHLTGEDGTVLVIEDHRPPVPTTEWKAGQPIAYRDIIQVPLDVNVTRLALRVGLFDPADPAVRFSVLDAAGKADRKPVVARLFVQREDLFQFTDGWLAAEYADGGRRSWRWMGPRGRIMVRQPGRAGFLTLDAGTMFKCFDQPPLLSWQLGQSQGAQPLAGDLAGLVIPVVRPELGPEWLQLDLALDRTFVPRACGAGDDDRTLGLMLRAIAFSSTRFEDGWYPPETSSGRTWRWMGAEARATAGLPPGDAILVVNGRVPIDRLAAPPRIVIELDGRPLESFVAASELIDRSYPLPRSLTGAAETVVLTVRTDQTYVPRQAGQGEDERRLGLRLESLEVVPVPEAAAAGQAGGA